MEAQVALTARKPRLGTYPANLWETWGWDQVVSLLSLQVQSKQFLKSSPDQELVKAISLLWLKYVSTNPNHI